MKIRTAQEMMTSNMLVKHYAGSIAYGTNLPTSDTDFRGIFVADALSIRTPFYPIKQAEDTSEADTVYYELANFMMLALDCNPNVIETLWVDRADIVVTSPAYELLRAHAGKLLSSKIAFTTSGYALSQLKRIKGHNKWLCQGDRGIQKLRTLYQEGKIDTSWLEQHFSEGIIHQVTK